MRAIFMFIMFICLSAGALLPSKAGFVDIDSFLNRHTLGTNSKVTDDGRYATSVGQYLNNGIHQRYKQELLEMKKRTESLIDLLKRKSKYNKKRKKNYFPSLGENHFEGNTYDNLTTKPDNSKIQSVSENHFEENTYYNSTSMPDNSKIQIDRTDNINLFTLERLNDYPTLAEAFEHLNPDKLNKKLSILKDNTQTDTTDESSKILNDTTHKEKFNAINANRSTDNIKNTINNILKSAGMEHAQSNMTNTEEDTDIQSSLSPKSDVDIQNQPSLSPKSDVDIQNHSSLSPNNDVNTTSKEKIENETVHLPQIQENDKSDMQNTHPEITIDKEPILTATNSAGTRFWEDRMRIHASNDPSRIQESVVSDMLNMKGRIDLNTKLKIALTSHKSEDTIKTSQKPSKIKGNTASVITLAPDKKNTQRLSEHSDSTRIGNSLSNWGAAISNVIPTRTANFIKERMTDIPAKVNDVGPTKPVHVEPAKTIDVPAKSIDVLEKAIDLPANTIDVPATVDGTPAETVDAIPLESIDFIPGRTSGILSVGINGNSNDQIGSISDGIKTEPNVKESTAYNQNVGDIIGISYGQPPGTETPNQSTEGTKRPEPSIGGTAIPNAWIGGTTSPNAWIGGTARPDSWIGGTARPDSSWIGGTARPNPLYDRLSGYLYNQLLDAVIENMGSDVLNLIANTAGNRSPQPTSPGDAYRQDIIGNTNPNSGWITESQGHMNEHAAEGGMETNQMNNWLNSLFISKR